jgi:hypothetical protein
MDKLQKTDLLLVKISSIIEQARQRVVSTVNLTMVYTYFEIGRYIVEDEQQGEQRAEYGKAVLKELSERLTERFGSGYSAANLLLMRKFFLIYQERVDTVYPIQDSVNTVYRIQEKVITDYPIQDFVNTVYEIQERVNTVYPIQDSVDTVYKIDKPQSISRFMLSWSNYNGKNK